MFCSMRTGMAAAVPARIGIIPMTAVMPGPVSDDTNTPAMALGCARPI